MSRLEQIKRMSDKLEKRIGIKLESKKTGEVSMIAKSWSATIIEDDLDWLEEQIDDLDERFLLQLLFWRDMCASEE